MNLGEEYKDAGKVYPYYMSHLQNSEIHESYVC
jgi:hypothetical protein